MRLLQSISKAIGGNGISFRMGNPDPLHVEVANEVQDFSIRNYKAYTEAYKNVLWSSDSDAEVEAESSDGGKHKLPRKKTRHDVFVSCWTEFRALYNARIQKTNVVFIF